MQKIVDLTNCLLDGILGMRGKSYTGGVELVAGGVTPCVMDANEKRPQWPFLGGFRRRI